MCANKKGFTLIELLGVISIIAILCALLIPTAGKAIDSARKTTAANNLRQIAMAYYTYNNSERKGINLNKDADIYTWAGILAQKADLTDPNLWIIKEDPLVQRNKSSLPKYISAPSSLKTNWELNPDFTKHPLSITVASRIPMHAPPSTTPVAWTRGLKTDGTWASETASTPGVYGSKGGFIAFLDGHVTWYDNLRDEGGQLVNYTTKKPTSNIYEALPPGTSVLDSTENIVKNK